MEIGPRSHLLSRNTSFLSMKTLILLCIVIAHALTAAAQDTEFTIHENGLIYDEQTMAKLGNIVDSLNLRFKSCAPKNYRALAQGYATVVAVEEDARAAKQAISNGISVSDLLKRYPGAEHRRTWIIKSRYRDYKNDKVISYSTLPTRNNDGFQLELRDKHSNDKTKGWVFHEEDGSLVAMHLEQIQSPPIPGQYTQLIQYVDCMIDTTAQIYLTDDRDRDVVQLSADSKISAYLKFAEDFEGEPQMPEIDWDSPFAQAQYHKYSREHEQWNNKRLASLDKKMKDSHYYKSLLVDAADEAIENGSGNHMLEFYVERYLSPELALEMKRLRRPVGFCSMDQTPRLHAQSICKLAAKTTQWDIFLRAHLDIMNDNFERRSDGSYAWAGRGTYLRELEELDINVLDLLIGTALRAQHVSDNHYFGDIGRIGRALSESHQKDVLEERLLAMIQDADLDLFNRLLMAYLFKNYNYHLQDETRKKENANRLMKAADTLPDGLAKNFRD